MDFQFFLKHVILPLIEHILHRHHVNHGERSKSENLAMNIRRTYKLAAHYPQVQEAIKLF